MDPRHTKIAEIALKAAGGYGFALAGGYAVSAHGMGSLPKITDADFDMYGCAPDELAGVRSRFADWCATLRAE